MPNDPDSNTIKLNPDTLLFLNRSRVVGGRYSKSECKRDELTGERRDTEIETKVVIENVTERKEAEAIVAYSHGLIRKATSVTLIGHLGPESKLAETIADFEGLQARATTFNASATTCHVEIGLLPIKIAVALWPEAIRAISAEAQGRLIEIREALKVGDSKRIDTALRLAKNLSTLAVGPVADGIEFGLDEARERFTELKRRCKTVGGVSETPESVGRTLDLSMLESAISMLTWAPPQASTLALVG